MTAQTVDSWLRSLTFGERYHKPANVSWHNLEHWINDAGDPKHLGNHAYWNHFEKYRLYRLRGDMFCLKCRCCGSVGEQRYA